MQLPRHHLIFSGLVTQVPMNQSFKTDPYNNSKVHQRPKSFCLTWKQKSNLEVRRYVPSPVVFILGIFFFLSSAPRNCRPRTLHLAHQKGCYLSPSDSPPHTCNGQPSHDTVLWTNITFLHISFDCCYASVQCLLNVELLLWSLTGRCNEGNWIISESVCLFN